MGLLYNRFLIFNEEGEDQQNPPQQDESQDQPTDYTQQDQEHRDTDNQDQTNDQNQQQDDQQPPDDQPTDYTEEDQARGDYGDENDGQEQNQDTTPSNTEESPVDDLKKQEEEMYAALTPEQLDIKHRELKNQFLSMFDTVSGLIEQINGVSVEEDSIHVIEFVSTQLSKLKSMLTDYVNYVYHTKSYIENSINYNRFLAVLNGMNKILEELNVNED